MTSLSIATSAFFNRTAGAMGALSKQADALQTQIATGKKLQAPSDDVSAYQRLRGIAAATADADADGANVKVAQGLLAQADTTLGAIGDQLSRVNELVLQARNGTLSASDRALIGGQLAGIAQTLVSLGNTTDVRGQPLFGGSDGAPAITATADGTHALSAAPVAAIPVGGGQSVQAGENAAKIFGLPNGGTVVDFVQALAATLTGGGTISDDQVKQAKDAGTQVSDVQASLGARAARLDIVGSQMTAAATDRETERSGLEDTDVTAAITQLQQTITVLQATQASFGKLSGLSLFDYLR